MLVFLLYLLWFNWIWLDSGRFLLSFFLHRLMKEHWIVLVEDDIVCSSHDLKEIEELYQGKVKQWEHNGKRKIAAPALYKLVKEAV